MSEIVEQFIKRLPSNLLSRGQAHRALRKFEPSASEGASKEALCCYSLKSSGASSRVFRSGAIKISDLLKIKKPLLMGILNVTPDSFSDSGTYFQFEDAINHAKKLIQQGVDIIDIGGESTKPGAKPVSEEEELRRVIPVISVIARRDEVPMKQSQNGTRREIASSPLWAPRNDVSKQFLISIDTYKSNVAQKAIEAGANIINDVSGLTMDPNMIHIVAKSNCPIVIMHNNGIPATKPDRRSAPLARPDDVIQEVYRWLGTQTNFAMIHGIKLENIIIDPGIGFGKTPEEDLILIENLEKFKSLGFPILVGPSRKSFIKKIFPNNDFEVKNKEIIDLCIKNRADIIRVHL